MENSKAAPRRLLDDSQIKLFNQNGYVAVPDVLSRDEVTAARTGLSEIVHEYLEPRNDNRLPKGPLVEFENGYDPTELAPDPVAAEMMVRKFMNFVRFKPVLGAIVRPGHVVVEIVSQLIGPSPILFQDMALVKPAFIGREKPWHQDNAYFSVAPLQSVCGVWIALDDAGVENGCMHILPGRHMDGAFIHHHGSDCEISHERLPLNEAIPVPIAVGGAMFFYGMLPHQTPPNRSAERRRALQFHFRGADSRVLPASEYNEIYAQDGAPASCAAAKRGI